MTTLNELRELLDEGLNDVIAEYLRDGALQLTQLHSAIEDSDIATVALICHTLKGSSGSLGVRDVHELCRLLEQEARRGVLVDGAASLAAIEAAFAEARGALAAFMNG